MRLAFFKTVGSGEPPRAAVTAGLGGRAVVAVRVAVGVIGCVGGRVPARAVAALMNGVAVAACVSVAACVKVAVGTLWVAVPGGGGAVGSGVTVLEQATVKLAKSAPTHSILCNNIGLGRFLLGLSLIGPGWAKRMHHNICGRVPILNLYKKTR